MEMTQYLKKYRQRESNPRFGRRFDPSLANVARTGFEPVICWLRTNRPGPLDERAKYK